MKRVLLNMAFLTLFSFSLYGQENTKEKFIPIQRVVLGEHVLLKHSGRYIELDEHAITILGENYDWIKKMKKYYDLEEKRRFNYTGDKMLIVVKIKRSYRKAYLNLISKQ